MVTYTAWHARFFILTCSFGVGNGTILLDNVNCYSTSYLHLLSCQYRTIVSSICDHTDDVAITCCKYIAIGF